MADGDGGPADARSRAGDDEPPDDGQPEAESSTAEPPDDGKPKAGSPTGEATGSGPPEAVSPTADGEGTDAADGESPSDRSAAGRREVVVPGRVYRAVTVFSTLVAAVGVVAGFAVLDVATTIVENPPGSLVVRALVAFGVPPETVTAHRSGLALAVGLAGLGLIAGAAAVYAYGTRFRAEGMGKPKDDADEPADDG